MTCPHVGLFCAVLGSMLPKFARTHVLNAVTDLLIGFECRIFNWAQFLVTADSFFSTVAAHVGCGFNVLLIYPRGLDLLCATVGVLWASSGLICFVVPIT